MKKKLITIPFILGLSLFLAVPLKANLDFDTYEVNNTVPLKKMHKEREKVVKGCEPFEFTGTNGKAFLLLHGLGGCPHEVRSLGESLNREGYTVIGIRYPGHGAKGRVMNDYGWQDWYNAAETEYLKLLESYDQVYVGGFSTGGTIALRLAEKYPVKKLVLLSPFINIAYKWYYGFTPEMYLVSVGRLIRDLPSNMTMIHINDPVARASYVRGENFSLVAARSALELIGLVKKDISKVESPALLMHSKGDETTDFHGSEFILKNISSKSKKLILLEKSNHIITLDYEKDLVRDEVKRFLEENLTGNNQ
jgi:carboxylesterase